MRTLFFVLLALVLVSCEAEIKLPAYLQNYKAQYLEDPRQANQDWFKAAEYGMFIHYGLYSLLEKGE